MLSPLQCGQLTKRTVTSAEVLSNRLASPPMDALISGAEGEFESTIFTGRVKSVITFVSHHADGNYEAIATNFRN